MATKKKIEMECLYANTCNYLMYRNHVLFLQRLYLTNLSIEELSGCVLQISSEPEFILPVKTEISLLPRERKVGIDTEIVGLSPYFLANVNDTIAGKLILRVFCVDKQIAEQTFPVKVLPYDYFAGVSIYPELLAGFSRPRFTGIAKILHSASDILGQWKMNTVLNGYAGEDKNGIRQVAAAIFTAIQMLEIERFDCTQLGSIGKIQSLTEILNGKYANELEMGLLFASCLEGAGLNPIVVLGKSDIQVMFWLMDNCLSEPVSDDLSELKKRMSDGINELAGASMCHLYKGANRNFGGSEKACQEALSNFDAYELAIDIKRCRLGGIRPLSERVKLSAGYELVTEEETKIGAKPTDIASSSKQIELKAESTKERQWERRLLDLSLRNTLLSFKAGAYNLHLLSTNLEETTRNIKTGNDLLIAEMPQLSMGGTKVDQPFSTMTGLKSLGELITVEFKNKRIRTYQDAKSMMTTLSALYRRERTSLEETGSSTLFVAAGFLKWQERFSKNDEKYAPLFLLPVTLTKKAGGKGYSIKLRDEEYHFNTTLLEFLMQEFGIDLRGLGDLKPNEFSVLDVIATVKNAIIHMKGWDILEDVYLASYSFSRFLMWNDIRYHMDEFRKNKVVQSLISGRTELLAKELVIPDINVDEDFAPEEILIPIVADASQFSAVAASTTGKSFVLHGPPGTGKSQTITNIIANALGQGKRVLFVAEKMAALSVVKRRLDEIGIGDFCLELHSNKVNKAEVAEKLLKTVELAGGSNVPEFKKVADRIAEMRSGLNREINALHRKRKLDISIYEGALRFLENKGAPDFMNVESTFFDSLTAESLMDYEGLLSELAISANECGGIYRTPFENMEVDTFSENLKRNASYTANIFAEEIRHIRYYSKLCFSIFKNRVRKLTKKKLFALVELCRMLCDEGAPYRRIFGSAKFEVSVKLLTDYANSSKHFEKLSKEYDENFRLAVELPASLAVMRAEYTNNKEEYRRAKNLKVLCRRLERAARHRLDERYMEEYLGLVIDLEYERMNLSQISDKLSDILGSGGKLASDKLMSMRTGLKKLYECAENLFSEYDTDSFNRVLCAIYEDFPNVYLVAFLRAYEDFTEAENNFFMAVGISVDYFTLDEDYFDFMSAKVGAFLENIDLLSSWCRFNTAAKKLSDAGMNFALQPLLDGKLTGDNLVQSFKKQVYGTFVESQVKEEPELVKFSGVALDEKIEKFRLMTGEFEKLTRKQLKSKLCERLPRVDTEGALSLEMVVLQRAAKSGMRGNSLRKLFVDIPNLLVKTAPCMLMSPITVSQYLEPKYGMFDLVVFDEASQMPTAEAVSVIARGKSVIVVGDPKQLPPTSFFSSDYTDENNLDNEDLESILEDCLALGMPEKHLLWHYRSRHESLIAFSNVMYYGNKLHTFPSPDAMESKVTLRYVDGIYDRGETKQNRLEAEELVAEIIRRLKDPELKKLSIGVVTFSTAQQEIVENLLNTALIKSRLESVAMEGDEPVFVKNLENVQGDERDVILFSVGYGPDKNGKLTQNFGPINQSAGWRRLNVAASRARAEMIVFSSMTAAMLDLSKTNSKGVAGLKAFLEFADKGRTMLAVRALDVQIAQKAMGYFIAEELAQIGYPCQYELGVSGFKIDTAVIDPKDSKRFILAILCDGKTAYESQSAKDRTILQVQTLKRLGWNVYRIWTVNFLNNPKREIKKIKDVLDLLTGRIAPKEKEKPHYATTYQTASIPFETYSSDYLFNPDCEEEILNRLYTIVSSEQPIAESLLVKRCLNSYGILRSGSRMEARMQSLCIRVECRKEKWDNTLFYFIDDTAKACDSYRIEDSAKLKRSAEEISPYEVVAVCRSVLEEKLNLYEMDLVKEVMLRLGFKKSVPQTLDRIHFGIALGVSQSLLTKTMSGNITLA